KYFSTIGPHSRLIASGTLAKPYPGRSTKIYFSSMRKKFNLRVCPGVLDVLTRLCLPSKVFISDDLPTLERPAKANSTKPSRGKSFLSWADVRNFALIISYSKLPVAATARAVVCRPRKRNKDHSRKFVQEGRKFNSDIICLRP